MNLYEACVWHVESLLRFNVLIIFVGPFSLFMGPIAKKKKKKKHSLFLTKTVHLATVIF